MESVTLEIASDESPAPILAIVGLNYNEFMRNMSSLYPKTGKAIVKMLTSGNQDRLYRQFVVFKKRAKVRKARLIFSPRKELKQLQQQLDHFVRGQFTNHPSSHGFVSGRSTRTAAEAVKAVANINEKELTNLDIKGAFPAVSGKAVRSLLRHKAITQLTAWQINILSKIACNSDDRLATGAPSSPTLFNWRLTAADNQIEDLCRSRNWKAIRYADDVSIVHHRTKKREVVEAIIGILGKFDLQIERSKLKTYRKDLKKIVGISVQYGELRISRKLRRIHRAIAHRLSKHRNITAKNNYDLEESYDAIRAIAGQDAYIPGSPAAQGTGFWAYVIHTLKDLKEKQCLTLQS
jgi:hypothetical protein